MKVVWGRTRYSQWLAYCCTCWRAASVCGGQACGSCSQREDSCPACSWTLHQETAAPWKCSGYWSRHFLNADDVTIINHYLPLMYCWVSKVHILMWCKTEFLKYVNCPDLTFQDQTLLRQLFFPPIAKLWEGSLSLWFKTILALHLRQKHSKSLILLFNLVF